MNLACLLLANDAGAGQGRVLHVSKAGNDANTGIATTYPIDLSADSKLTFASALAAAGAGDTIVVWPGTYAEKLDITKDLTVDGFGLDKTIFSVASGAGGSVHFSSVSNFEVRGVSCITSDTGSDALGFDVGNSGSTMVRGLLEDCYLEGDFDGIHCKSANNITLRRVHGKGKFDGIQTGSGENRLIEDCVAETDGTNTTTGRVNAFVNASARNVIVRNLICKARRASATNDRDVAGCDIRGENVVIDGLVLDVDHTGDGVSKAFGLYLGDAADESILITNVSGRVENTKGTSIGIKAAHGNPVIAGVMIQAQAEASDGTAIGVEVTDGKACVVVNGHLDTIVPAPILSGSVTGQVSGFEDSRFKDSGRTGLPDDTINGWLLVWLTGPNANESAVVDDFVQSGGEVRFASAFTNDIQVGDTYDLYISGVGPPTEYSLKNGTGTLTVGNLEYDRDKTSGTITQFDPATDASGGMDITSVGGTAIGTAALNRWIGGQ